MLTIPGRFLCLLVALPGCGEVVPATAADGGENGPAVVEGVQGGGGDSGTPTDGPQAPDSPEDQDPGRLTQNLSQSVDPTRFLYCVPLGDGEDDPQLRQAFYRVFDIGTATFPRGFAVTSVEFGINRARAADGAQPVIVALYALEGDMSLDNLSLLQEVTVEVPDQTGTLFRAPVQHLVPAGTRLAVEIFVPDGTLTGDVFRLGANRAGETAGSYVWAVDCLGDNRLYPTSQIEMGMHLLISVRGAAVSPG